jgi:hypothetical protein
MGASNYGFHFYSEYRTCPRAWFYHQVCGLERSKKSDALRFGSAIHKAIEVWFTTKSFEAASAAALEEYGPLSGEDVNPLPRIEIVLRTWLPIGEKLLETYDIRPELTLTDGATLTGRIDFVAAHRANGVYYLGEIKTTSQSPIDMLEAVRMSDQLVMYTHLVKKNYPGTPLGGGLALAIYSKGNVCKIEEETFYINAERVEEYIEGLAHTASRIGEDLAALENDAGKARSIFPKNTGLMCRWCPFSNLCGSGVRSAEIAEVSEMAGFTRDATQRKRIFWDFGIIGEYEYADRE